MKARFTLMLVIASFISFSQIHTVTNLSDSGPGSLRQEVFNAASGDTVLFDPALLSAGSDTLHLYFPVAIDKNLTIRGLFDSQDTLYISGGDSTQIFYMDFTGIPGGEVWLEDLVICHAKHHSDDDLQANTNGGAVMALYVEELHLNHVYFRNNRATGRAMGGALFVGRGDLYLNHCEFTENQTDTTGVYDGGWGGAVRFYSGELYVDDCVFVSNFSNGRGGAIASAVHYTEIRNTSFIGNTAGNPQSTVLLSRIGGAVTIACDTTVLVDQCLFRENYAVASGGAIYSNGSSTTVADGHYLQIRNSLFEENNAPNRGMAVDYLNINVDIEGSTFSDHRSTTSMGVVHGSENLRLRLSTFSGNSGHMNETFYLGFADTVDVLNSTFVAASPASSGEIFYIVGQTSGNLKFSTKGSIYMAGSLFNKANPFQTMISGGYNTFPDGPSLAGGSDLTFVDSTSLDLMPLAMNGGLTPTHVAGNLSFALDFGDPSDYSPAQNGPIFGRRDIGAADARRIMYDSASSCQPVTWWGNVYSDPGTYTDTAYGFNTIDSVGVLTLVGLDAEVIIVDGDMSVSDAEASMTYQWMECSTSGLTPVAGATDSVFEPMANGDYAVVVTYFNCTDTSDCYTYDQIGVNEVTDNTAFILYPNPTSGVLYLECENIPTKFVISDMAGREIMSGQVYSRELSLSNIPPGMYVATFIWSDHSIRSERIIISRE